MKAATIHEISRELKEVSASQVRDLCIRLAKYKKENKELLTYLLFEAHDEQQFIREIRSELENEFEAIPNHNVYYLKKSVRRILRLLNKQIRYSGQPATELELRIAFCEQMKKHSIPVGKGTVLGNLYEQQLKKIQQVLSKLDEDLQFDYEAQIENIK